MSSSGDACSRTNVHERFHISPSGSLFGELCVKKTNEVAATKIDIAASRRSAHVRVVYWLSKPTEKTASVVESHCI